MDPFDLRLWKGFVEAGGNAALPAITDQITIDSRRIDSKNALFVALEGKHADGHNFIANAVAAGARFILAKKNWSPSESLNNAIILRVDNPLLAFQQIAGEYRSQMNCKVIAVVGSYGKTMVKDLLQEILSVSYPVAASPESFNSQVGVPLSLLTIRKEHQIAIIEAGISEANEMDALSEIIKADHAILTHIGRKHISTLGDLNTIAREMLKILAKPSKEGWAVLPKDPQLLAHSIPANVHFWTERSSNLPHAQFTSEERGEKMSYSVNFPSTKPHYGEVSSGFYYFLDLINIAAKAAWLLGATSEAICRTLQNYTPEPMRTEIWKSPVGTVFINDTYCSDPQSVDSALKHLTQVCNEGRRIFIFGGIRRKHQHMQNDYKRIGLAIHKAGIDILLLFGPHDFQPLVDEIRLLTPLTEIIIFASHKEALDYMRDRAKSNDAILIKGENKYPIDHITEVFNDSICSNQCVINLAAIAENIQTLRHRINPNTNCMVIVKALAYGTDEVRMAKFLKSCNINILGVSYVEEGVALKRAGATQSIFVINAATYEAAKVVKWGLQIGVSEKSLIEAVAAEAKLHNKKIKVHLHVDTGMSRFGCRPEEALSLAQYILDHPSLELHGIMTHFACADDPAQDDFTRSQAARFDEVISELKSFGIDPQWKHASNSSGTIRFNFKQYNMVRLGLAVYGLHSSQATKDAIQLRLALSLFSRIVGINHCKHGETISYGRSYKVERETQKIAVLPIGYFDGMHRNYSGKGVVTIRGKKAPMVGKICMDFMMIDVTNIPNAGPGDSVLIFGEDEYGYYLSPEELASSGDSIIHELITCLGPRIQRIFVYEEARRAH